GLGVRSFAQSVAEVGFAYTSTLVGEGRVVPYTWSVNGPLRDGLQLSAVAATISATPKTVGTVALNFTATDKTNRSISKPCSINVQPPIAISTTSLGAGSTGASYSDGVTVGGGVSPYVYSTTAGSLPPGLTIDGATGK